MSRGVTQDLPHAPAHPSGSHTALPSLLDAACSSAVQFHVAPRREWRLIEQERRGPQAAGVQSSPWRLTFQTYRGAGSRVFLTALFKNSKITKEFYIEFHIIKGKKVSKRE